MTCTTALLLPGTGSDEFFVRSAFAGPLRAAGITLAAPPPPSDGTALIEGYLAAFEATAVESGGKLLVGGVSLGAHLAAEWALRHPERCSGLLLALPAWNGVPDGAPASVAARISAEMVERDGLDDALRTATDGVAPWLAAELRRAWPRHGAGLAAGLRAAGAHPAPTLEALARLRVPVGIAACTDDPVHPVAVAHAWAAALPRAHVCETTLAALGETREALGRAAVEAWQRASAL
ncbi:alpha/beta fold hydrolase [Amycolatopsis sp. 195334CR]|uniref:alpha/beta fold hydrolase n=1 Tax=Amycolatopsis sp. 195334CR TaxID=2814588 RepID=UPI001A9096B2|nr:alpha/beta hydrolase [Amycolatopsis sp. 195334CR]MBN6038719.1 alpha/beta hydrolase [Amycolatopsis sp. 195334CR]